MELTLDQALQKGIEAHKAGQVQEADRYYTAILKVSPKHPDANHNMGLLAVGVGKVTVALPFFKKALAVNPNISQFWLSYIDALVKLAKIDDAKAALDQAKSNGVKGDVFDQLEALLSSSLSKNSNTKEPSNEQLQSLINLYKQNQWQDVHTWASQLLKEFPESINLYNIIGTTNKRIGKLDEALEAYKKAISFRPDYAEAYYNMGVILQEQGKREEALQAYNKVISIKPDAFEAYNNIGNALKEQGRLLEAIKSYKKALSIKPDYAEAYYNMGCTLQEQGNLKEAIEAYNKCLSIWPDYAEAYWNLYGTAKNINDAKKWIKKCLEVDSNHLRSQLTLCALKFYEGDKSDYNALVESSLKDHPYTRSFAWVFNLPQLPQIHFHRWAMFNHMVDLSIKDRPFYEFGVWRGEAFKYLIKTFKKGYGFDTFEGLPEDWHNEKTGTYSSDGNIPTVKGGEFIVGKFEDTLPGFFAEKRPMASIINFDADLYSSTICALNFAKPVIDHHTILIFDEFIINKNWEQDEYRALEEFCSNNDYTFEVLAISFFTKQVAVKLIGI